LDLDEDFILSPLPQQIPEPVLGIDGSALEPEIGRDAMQRPDESMLDVQAENLSLLGKGPDDGRGDLADLTREELANVNGSGLLQFGDSSLLGMSRGLEDVSMVPTTQEAALQEAEAEILAQRANQAKPSKRRRLNLSELVANEATSLSPDEIRNRLNDAADIMRMPTYLPTSSSARLEDMSSAAIASRLLSLSDSTPFAALFAAAGPEAEQEVPADVALDGSFEYTAPNLLSGELEELAVPEYEGMEADEFRFEDGGDEFALGGGGAVLSGDQREAELLLADKSVEQLEQLEEESFQRRAEEQSHQGISLFAKTLPVRDEDISLAVSHLADQGIEEQTGIAASPSADAERASGHSKNTIRAIHMLDSACKAENIPVSETSSPREGASLSFANVTKGARRTDSVKLFFELLVLKTKDFVDVKQQVPFDDILIAPRSKLRRAAESIQ
ncbi:sister chromatid cohesion protein 1, partial [Coemansia sp. RSA 2399]